MMALAKGIEASWMSSRTSQRTRNRRNQWSKTMLCCTTHR
jgi:hypothetical protein